MKRFACIFLAALLLLLSCASCAPKENAIDWDLSATVIDTNTKEVFHTTLTVKGANSSKAYCYSMKIALGYRCRWRFGSPQFDGYGDYLYENLSPSGGTAINISSIAMDLEKNTPTGMWVGIDLEEGFVILSPENEADTYIVASTDPSATPEEILQKGAYFTEHWKKQKP